MLDQRKLTATQRKEVIAGKKKLEDDVKDLEHVLFIQETLEDMNFRIGYEDGIDGNYICCSAPFYSVGYMSGLKERQVEQIKKNPKQAGKRIEKELKEKRERIQIEKERLQPQLKFPQKN